MWKKFLYLWQQIYMRSRNKLCVLFVCFLILYKGLSVNGRKQKFIGAWITKCIAVENVALYFMGV